MVTTQGAKDTKTGRAEGWHFRLCTFRLSATPPTTHGGAWEEAQPGLDPQWSWRKTGYDASRDVADNPNVGAPRGLFPPARRAGLKEDRQSAKPRRPLQWRPIEAAEPTRGSRPTRATARATAPSIVPVAPPSRRGRARPAAASVPNLPFPSNRFEHSYSFQLINPPIRPRLQENHSRETKVFTLQIGDGFPARR